MTGPTKFGHDFISDPIIAERLHEWRPSYEPVGDEEEWLFRQVVVSSVRVDWLQREEALRTRYEARRAGDCWDWDQDRRLAAEITASALRSRPAMTVAKLRRTRQGCAFLIERWQGLKAILERGQNWDEAQTALVFDLLGTPREFRDRPPWLGKESAFVDAEIAALERLKVEKLDALDEEYRSAAQHGINLDPSSALTRIRRDESAQFRRMLWASDQLRDPKRLAKTPPQSSLAPSYRFNPPAQDLPSFASPAAVPARPELITPPAISAQPIQAAPSPNPPRPNRKARRAALKRR